MKKTIKNLALFILSIFIISCGKDEDSSENNNCVDEYVSKIIIENEVEFDIRYNGDKVSKLVYFEGSDSLEIKINYDANNNIISIYDDFDEYIDTFIYNSSNQIIQSFRYDITDGIKKFESKYTYTYNNEGKLISERDSTQNIYILPINQYYISKFDYTYNSAGDHYTTKEVAQYLEDGVYESWYTDYDTTFYTNINNPIKSDASISNLIDVCRLLFFGEQLDYSKLISKIRTRTDPDPYNDGVKEYTYEYTFYSNGKLKKYYKNEDITDAIEFIYGCK